MCVGGGGGVQGHFFNVKMHAIKVDACSLVIRGT